MHLVDLVGDGAHIRTKLGEVHAGGHVEAGALHLIEQAEEGGGTDNVTVVIARFCSRRELERHAGPPPRPQGGGEPDTVS